MGRGYVPVGMVPQTRSGTPQGEIWLSELWSSVPALTVWGSSAAHCCAGILPTQPWPICQKHIYDIWVRHILNRHHKCAISHLFVESCFAAHCCVGILPSQPWSICQKQIIWYLSPSYPKQAPQIRYLTFVYGKLFCITNHQKFLLAWCM